MPLLLNPLRKDCSRSWFGPPRDRTLCVISFRRIGSQAGGGLPTQQIEFDPFPGEGTTVGGLGGCHFRPPYAGRVGSAGGVVSHRKNQPIFGRAITAVAGDGFFEAGDRLAVVPCTV